MILSRLQAACAFVAAAGMLTTTAIGQTLVKLGHDQPESSTHHQAALKWKELVEARTNGKVRVQIFPSSMLGSGVQTVEQLQAGAIEAASLPTAWVAPLAPSLQVLDLPFLFPNRDVAHRVIDGPVGAAILEPLQKVNIVGVGFWESGFKQFTGNFPIRTPADYQGHKIRTMPAQVIQEQFKAFGAIPTTIAFGELYSALQQKVVDGQENPIVTIAAMRANKRGCDTGPTAKQCSGSSAPKSAQPREMIARTPARRAASTNSAVVCSGCASGMLPNPMYTGGGPASMKATTSAGKGSPSPGSR